MSKDSWWTEEVEAIAFVMIQSLAHRKMTQLVLISFKSRMTVAMKSSTVHPYTSTNEKFFCTRRRQIKGLSDRKNREKEVTKSIHICSSYTKYAKKKRAR